MDPERYGHVDDADCRFVTGWRRVGPSRRRNRRVIDEVTPAEYRMRKNFVKGDRLLVIGMLPRRCERVWHGPDAILLRRSDGAVLRMVQSI